MTSGLVIDASATLACLLSDEFGDKPNDLARSLLEQGAFAPAVWPTEVLNGLLEAVRQARIAPDRHTATVCDLSRFQVAIQPPMTSSVYALVSQLALETGLTVYDATYLELALTRRLPLVTLDQRLLQAARDQGVTVRGVLT